ncbi:MAG TPA: potassium-transporting ATPase subunit KdpC [Telluria sp.]|nr:potassium-transporting ATPase subunit KdpC [Telluria sp.]
MLSQIRPAVSVFALLTVICCGLYPLAVTVVGQAVFPSQAAGSLVYQGTTLRGSGLIGQSFTSPKYFWGRSSATGPMPNNAAGSSGSNQGPTNPAYADAVKGRVDALKAADPGNQAAIPVDLVTASGSGLDPELSVAGIRYQLARVARARGVPEATIAALVDKAAVKPALGFLGEPRVNVLALNLELDQIAPAK